MLWEGRQPEADRCQARPASSCHRHCGSPPGAPGPAGAATSLPGWRGAAPRFAGRSGMRGDQSPAGLPARHPGPSGAPGGGSLGSGVHRPPRAEHRADHSCQLPPPPLGPGGTLSHTFHSDEHTLGPGGGDPVLACGGAEMVPGVGTGPAPPASGARSGAGIPLPDKQGPTSETACLPPAFRSGAWGTPLWSAVPQGPLPPGRDPSSHTRTSSSSSLPTGNMRLPG